MKIPSQALSVNAKAIGEALYKVICERGEAPIVAFGMLPLWAKTALERSIKARIVAIVAEQTGIPASDVAALLSPKELAEVAEPIIHAVYCEILQAAKEERALCV